MEETTKKEKAAEAQQKRRMIGNIIFIGELYKEAMLTDKIMHQCVFRRLLGDIKNPSEADLEALCKLMNTIGKVLDTNKARGSMDAYFSRMLSLTQNPNLSSRIRYLIRDVLDLRANAWKGVVIDKPGKGVPARSAPLVKPAPSAGARPAHAPSSSNRPGAGPGASSRDGWELAASRNSRGGSASRGAAQPEVSLRPGNSRAGGPAGSATKSWANKRPQDSRRDAGSSSQTTRSNMFDALTDDNPDVSPMPESRSAKPVRERGGRTGGDRKEPSPDNAEKAEKAVPEEPSEQFVETLDPNTEQRIDILLEEFLSNRDEEEARMCVEEISTSGFKPHLVKAIIVKASEKKEETREMFLRLSSFLAKKSVINALQYAEGIRLVLAQLPDLRLDAPAAPKVVGQFIADALLDDKLDPGVVMPNLERLAESGLAITVLGSLINFYIDSTSIGQTREWLADTAKWDISCLFKGTKGDPASIAGWLQSNSLDRVFPLLWLKAMLEKEADVGDILERIQENVPAEVWQTDTFAQQLTHSFFKFVSVSTNSLSENEKLIEETRLLDKYTPLLKKFLSDSQLQLACLSAVQHFCFEQNFPQGLLERIFETLYQREIVYEEPFRKWADAAADSSGKTQALKQLAGWLEWLATAKNEDDGEDEPS